MSELWIKLAVNFPRHPKVIQAGPEAAWLAVCAMAYCREHLTDGVLPAAVVPTLAGVKRPLVVAAKLVEVGLWEAHEDAFVVHDFLKWNPSRAEVESTREKWKDKKKNQRSVPEGHSVGHSRESSEIPHVRADAPAPHARSASVSSLPVVEVSEGGAGETTPLPSEISGGMWRQRSRSPGLLQGPIAHAKCYASEGCGRGLCVPGFLGAEWLGQCSGDTSQVDAFIAGVLKFTPAGPQGDPVKWWRAQWDAKFRGAGQSAGPRSLRQRYRPEELRQLVRSNPRSWVAECVREHDGGCVDEDAHDAKMGAGSQVSA